MDGAVPTEVEAPNRPKTSERRPPKRRNVFSPAAVPKKKTKRSLDESLLAEPLPNEDNVAGMLFNMTYLWLVH